MAPVLLTSGLLLLAFTIVTLLASARMSGFIAGLLHASLFAFGAFICLPAAYLFLSFTLPHLVNPSELIDALHGTFVSTLAGLLGGTGALTWYRRLETSDLRKHLNRSRTEMRRQDEEALEQMKHLAARDPSLRPLVDQLRSSQKATRRFLAEEGLFTDRRRERSKGRD